MKLKENDRIAYLSLIVALVAVFVAGWVATNGVPFVNTETCKTFDQHSAPGFWCHIHTWQTVIAAIIALGGAWLTVRAIQKQINASETQHLAQMKAISRDHLVNLFSGVVRTQNAALRARNELVQIFGEINQFEGNYNFRKISEIDRSPLPIGLAQRYEDFHEQTRCKYAELATEVRTLAATPLNDECLFAIRNLAAVLDEQTGPLAGVTVSRFLSSHKAESWERVLVTEGRHFKLMLEKQFDECKFGGIEQRGKLSDADINLSQALDRLLVETLYKLSKYRAEPQLN
ncbi:hypothetical protein [Roseibium sp. SCP14]|uniref:hypothetical protein n=1 Tax=Roseibium sp. SCP14 TaxID=3141375 RepID=UPI00333D54E2